MKRLLVVAPHPDDETLGCGGLMLRARSEGTAVYWLLVTRGLSVPPSQTDAVAAALGVTDKFELGHTAAQLEGLPRAQLVGEISEIVDRVSATDVYLPFRRDAHSDHSVVFDAGTAATKWFRHESVRRILTYETLSETDFDIAPDSFGFRPNLFVDISDVLDKKIKTAAIYKSEFQPHPFPRSLDGIRALATLRGAASGFHAAEAFMTLRERE